MAWAVRGAVLGAYLGAVGLVTSLASGTVGQVIAALSTLAVAVTLAPAQRAAERLAGRLTKRPLNPYDTMTALGVRLSTPGRLEDVAAEIARTVAQGSGASSVEVRVEGDDEVRTVARWGTDDSADEPLTVALRDGGATVGSLVLKPASAVSEEGSLLVGDLADAAGPALRAARLSAQLAARRDERRAQTERLRAARRAVVATHDAERRRLERDIHDGAQQHVVHLLVQVGALADGAGRLSTARAALDRVRSTLHALARGLVAPDLERGLPYALAAAAPPGARVRIAPLPFLSPDAEAALYFAAAEALQNAAKHAPGAALELQVAPRLGRVRAVVRDEGPGFDRRRARKGAGLANLRARIAEAGGTVDIESSPGTGTTVVIEVPL